MIYILYPCSLIVCVPITNCIFAIIQVVMSHSPLKMFRDYHKKHVLVIGQGPVDYIARSLGFSKVIKIETCY